MNVRLIMTLVVALSASQASAQGKAAKPTELKTTRDKASYSFGMMIGSNLKKQGVDLDVNLLVQGIREATGDGKTLLSEEDAGTAIQAFEKDVAAKKLQESKDFLLANKKRPGVKSTASGLQYKVLKAGKGPKPLAADSVTVVYRGTFVNGNEFDSSQGKPFTIGVADVIPGWQEALQLMEVGSKWQLFIPSELAYGDQGQPPIGPNATLVFDLELLKTEKPQAAGASKPRAKIE